MGLRVLIEVGDVVLVVSLYSFTTSQSRNSFSSSQLNYTTISTSSRERPNRPTTHTHAFRDLAHGPTSRHSELSLISAITPSSQATPERIIPLLSPCFCGATRDNRARFLRHTLLIDHRQGLLSFRLSDAVAEFLPFSAAFGWVGSIFFRFVR
jgi:hypothetical protein